jgi:hypothetical protein
MTQKGVYTSAVTTAEVTSIEVHPPGRVPSVIGIILRDLESGRFYFRLRPGWTDTLAEAEDREVVGALMVEFEQKLRAGSTEFLDDLSEASHLLRVTRSYIQTTNDLDTELDHRILALK